MWEQKSAVSDIQAGKGRRVCDPHQLLSFGSSLRSQTLPGDKAILWLPSPREPQVRRWPLGTGREELPQKGWWPGRITRAQPAKFGFSQGLRQGVLRKFKTQLSVRIDLLISKKKKGCEQKKQLQISCFTSSRHFKQARDCSACLIIWEETRILFTSRVPHITCKVRKRELSCGSYVKITSSLPCLSILLGVSRRD